MRWGQAGGEKAQRDQQDHSQQPEGEQCKQLADLWRAMGNVAPHGQQQQPGQRPRQHPKTATAGPPPAAVRVRPPSRAPLPRSSNMVCIASASPRVSGSFTLSTMALRPGILGCVRERGEEGPGTGLDSRGSFPTALRPRTERGVVGTGERMDVEGGPPCADEVWGRWGHGPGGLQHTNAAGRPGKEHMRKKIAPTMCRHPACSTHRLAGTQHAARTSCWAPPRRSSCQPPRP